MKYVKKPIPIEAVKMSKEGFLEEPQWLLNALSINKVCYSHVFISRYNFADSKDGFIVQTLEGNMKGRIGDYIIRGVDGELYPCKGDIFEKTYSLVEENI